MTLPTLERWPLVGRRLHLESLLDALEEPKRGCTKLDVSSRVELARVLGSDPPTDDERGARG